MNAERHMRNIIQQSTNMVIGEISKAIAGEGMLRIEEIEKRIKLAVECAYTIGYEQANSERARASCDKQKKPLIRMNAKMQALERYNSQAEAARDTQTTIRAIKRAISRNGFSGGYKWKYA